MSENMETNKRKAEDELINDSNKKYKVDNTNYSCLLNELSTFCHQIETYIKQYDNTNTSNEFITHKLNFIKDLIPRIVITGMQSAGKTTLIELLFKFKHISTEGTGTLCPIEIRIGDYQVEKTYILRGNEKFDCASPKEAEQKIKEFTNSNNLCHNCIIVEEVPSKTVSVIIIDLPGFNALPENKKYFEALANYYLNKPNTKIVNVMRGDIDPSNDLSMLYVPQTNNDIITVLTHTDIWSSDVGKFKIFELIHDKNYVNTIAVVNNKKDQELEILNKQQYISKKPLIKGTVNLESFIVNDMFKMIQSTKPQILKLSEELLKSLEVVLTHIGFNSPNMRELVIHFRRDMITLIKNEIRNDNTEFSICINKVKKSFNYSDIYNFIDDIPNEKSLADELRCGSRRKIQGSEGWDSILSKYFKILINKVKTIIVPQLLTKYIDVLNNFSNKLLTIENKPGTLQSQIDIKNKCSQYLLNMKDKVINKLNHDLDMKSEDPSINVEQYMTNFLTDIHTPFAEKLINIILKNGPGNGDKNTNKSLIKQVVSSMEKLDSYEIKATFAYSQLKNLWDVESMSIFNDLITHISNMDREFESKLEDLIQRVEHTELHEDPIVDQKRKMLKELILNLENITKLIIG